MDKFVKEITVLVVAILTISCSPQKYIRNKTDNMIQRIYTKNKIDTIFSYSSHNIKLLWFYEEDGIQSYIIKPYKVTKYPRARARNIKISDEDIEQYFNESIEKKVECFPTLLFDGESIKVYIKGEDKFHSFFDMRCLFNKKYEINSFPYKVQYDFSKIFRPEEYSFEEMYGEVTEE